MLFSPSSPTSQHLESLVSLEQKVLSLLSDPNADSKARKREARIFPAAKSRQQQPPALDEIKIFRPTKHDTPAPTGRSGDDGNVREAAEPAEPV